LEEAFRKQQQDEIAARQAEKERVERERIEARKRQEVQRITEVSSLLYIFSIIKSHSAFLAVDFVLPLSSSFSFPLDIQNVFGITLIQSLIYYSFLDKKFAAAVFCHIRRLARKPVKLVLNCVAHTVLGVCRYTDIVSV
jgi:hypothetical protein